jgi:hypothetical protein
VWMLTGAFELEPARLRRAIAATFARRNTAIPTEVRISGHRGRSFQPIVDGISDERGRRFRLIVDDVSA